MIPAGAYVARATGQSEFGQSDRGTDYLWINFEITRGELEHEKIGAYLYFSDAAASRSIEALRYCGCTFPGDDMTDLVELNANEVELIVEHDTYNGETKAKVKWINSFGGRGVKEEQKMTPSAKASFKSRMRGKLLSDSRSAVTTPVTALKSNLPEGDLPF